MKRSSLRQVFGWASIIAVALLLAVAAPAPARAQAPRAGEQAGADQPAASGEDKTPKVQVERGAGGKKVYVIKTGFVIEGRIQKPNAFYVLQRSQINYDWADLSQSFVPRILEAVKKSPF